MVLGQPGGGGSRYPPSTSLIVCTAIQFTRWQYRDHHNGISEEAHIHNSFAHVPMIISRSKSMYYTLVSEMFQGWESSSFQPRWSYLAARSKVLLIARLAFNDCTSAYWRLVEHLMAVMTIWYILSVVENLLQSHPWSIFTTHIFMLFGFGMFIRTRTMWHYRVGSDLLWWHIAQHMKMAILAIGLTSSGDWCLNGEWPRLHISYISTPKLQTSLEAEYLR